MGNLLFEIGCEELPASAVNPSVSYLGEAIHTLLQDEKLSHGEIWTAGTPRRLVVAVETIQERQEDRTFEVTGPKASVAWDDGGELTRAALGFLKGRGADPSKAYKKDTKKGEVIAAQVTEVGKSARDVLGDGLQEMMSRIPFAKSMRWTDDRGKFARPVRWLLATFDGETLPVEFNGVTATDKTRGHRFMAPDSLSVASKADYLSAMKKGHIVVSFDDRRRMIEEKASALAKTVGGTLRPDPALLDTVANLVEQPWPILGSFDEKFLETPKAILLSEMREHQKYFAIEDSAGQLLPHFVVVAGSRPQNEAGVAKGNRRVLTSRFEDGSFYFKEDKRTPLKQRRERLKSVMFQRDLGTVLDKSVRVEKIVEHLAGALSLTEATTKVASRAAHLAKCDLVTGVVGEFPSLQGHIGRIYACADGEDEDVGLAIEEHYFPTGRGEQVAQSAAGAVLAIADRTDTLVGILSALKPPTGSADPFGLRRATIGILETSLHHGFSLSLRGLIEAADRLLPESTQRRGAKHVDSVLAFVHARMVGVLTERLAAKGLTAGQDVVEAVLADAENADDVCLAANKADALATFRHKDETGFATLASTFKRVGNILKKARADGETFPAEVDVSALTNPAEVHLSKAIVELRDVFHKAGQDASTYDAALVAVSKLKPVVADFFDNVMVMDPEPTIRQQRLGLLGSVEQLLVSVADFTKIQANQS